MFLTQKALPHIRSGGSIVNIGSAGAKANGNLPAAVYVATKVAVASWAIVLAKELGAKGIRINTVAPGFINTDMLLPPFHEAAKESSVFKRLGEAEDVAKVVAFVADSNKSGWITGQNVEASGGSILQF